MRQVWSTNKHILHGNRCGSQKTFAIDNSKFKENDYNNLSPINDDYYASHYSQQIKFLKHKFSFLVPKMFTQKPQKQTRTNTLQIPFFMQKNNLYEKKIKTHNLYIH